MGVSEANGSKIARYLRVGGSKLGHGALPKHMPWSEMTQSFQPSKASQSVRV